MRRPHLRFTLRRLMLAVALVAVVICGSLKGIELRRKVKDYRERAGVYGAMQRWADAEAARKAERIARWADRPEDPRQERWARELARSRDQSAYFSSLRGKYNRLAARPWEPATPDPPPLAGYPAQPPPGSN